MVWNRVNNGRSSAQRHQEISTFLEVRLILPFVDLKVNA
jgi:hypothetical protein